MTGLEPSFLSSLLYCSSNHPPQTRSAVSPVSPQNHRPQTDRPAMNIVRSLSIRRCSDSDFPKVFKNRAYGDLAGVFWGNLMQGFSVGWWKNKHNTHHAVPNLHESSADAHDGARVCVGFHVCGGLFLMCLFFLLQNAFFFFLTWFCDRGARFQGIELRSIAFETIHTPNR